MFFLLLLFGIEWREGTNDSIMLIVLLMSWIARREERRRQWNRFFFLLSGAFGAPVTLLSSSLVFWLLFFFFSFFLFFPSSSFILSNLNFYPFLSVPWFFVGGLCVCLCRSTAVEQGATENENKKLWNIIPTFHFSLVCKRTQHLARRQRPSRSQNV